MKPLILGHRGASALAPENTLAALRLALELGADGSEFDVQLSADGEAMVIHDDTLMRTTGRAGRVAELTACQLAELDAGSWFARRCPQNWRSEFGALRVPTLAQVFELYKASSSWLYVEMKCVRSQASLLAARVADLIVAYDLIDRVVVESFLHPALLEIKRCDERIKTSALFEPKLTRPLLSHAAILRRAREFEVDELALHRLLATKPMVHAAALANLHTVVWTTDSKAWVRRALNYGVHGLISNDPGALVQARDKLPAKQE